MIKNEQQNTKINNYLLSLLTQEETNFFDFKERWYDNVGDLILDILCMANSDADSDKYLIIGVENNTRAIKDVSTDSNRKTEENLHDIVQKSDFNIKPTIFIRTLSTKEGNIDVIIIKNTRNKPYFLLKDRNIEKQGKKRTIRAGVIYTRDGSVNTPIDSTASEYQIAQMWQERFGLTLNPLDRLYIYIQNTDKWKAITIDGDMMFYYSDFPEFTIKFHRVNDNGTYDWSKSIGSSFRNNLYFRYHETVLKELLCSHVDDGRYFIVYPDFCWIYYKGNFEDINVVKFGDTVSDKGKNMDLLEREKYTQEKIYYQIQNSFEYYVEKIYNAPSNLRHFFKYGILQRILLLKQDDNICEKCRNEFLRTKNIKPL